MRVILRPLGPDDETEARAAHTELLADGFEFLFGLTEAMTWSEYLDLRANSAAGIALPSHLVADTFLGAFVDGELIGRMSLRHSLDDPAGFLRLAGGHIGYAVRPAHRRRGYAGEILRLSLDLAAGRGIDPALLTCNDTNLASAGVIEGCGGRFDSLVTDPKTGQAKRRYWVPTSTVAPRPPLRLGTLRVLAHSLDQPGTTLEVALAGLVPLDDPDVRRFLDRQPSGGHWRLVQTALLPDHPEATARLTFAEPVDDTRWRTMSFTHVENRGRWSVLRSESTWPAVADE